MICPLRTFLINTISRSFNKVYPKILKLLLFDQLAQ